MTTSTLSRDRWPTERGLRWPTARWAGLGGLTFLCLVVAQNLVSATTAPANDATAGQILAFARNDAWSEHLLFATYVIAFPGLFAFAGGLSRLAARRSTRAVLPGRTGQYSVVATANTAGGGVSARTVPR